MRGIAGGVCEPTARSRRVPTACRHLVKPDLVIGHESLGEVLEAPPGRRHRRKVSPTITLGYDYEILPAASRGPVRGPAPQIIPARRVPSVR